MATDRFRPPSGGRGGPVERSTDPLDDALLDHDLCQASVVQRRLFGSRFPDLDSYQFFAECVPAHRFSGEFWEVVPRRDGQECVLLLAGVVSRGVSASILTGCLVALTAIAVERGLAPHEILGSVSLHFYRRTRSDCFATMVVAALEPASGKVRYANAGHPPAFTVGHSGDIGWLQPTGAALGLLPDADYHSEETSMDPGDMLVLYSGGFTHLPAFGADAIDPDQIAEVFSRHRTADLPIIASHLHETLRRVVRGRRPWNDRTLVIARRTPGTGSGATEISQRADSPLEQM